MATTQPKTPAKQREAAASKRLYMVVSPLRTAEGDYEVGAEVELSEAEAEPLLGHTLQLKPQT